MEQQKKRAKHINKSKDTDKKRIIAIDIGRLWMHIHKN